MPKDKELIVGEAAGGASPSLVLVKREEAPLDLEIAAEIQKQYLAACQALLTDEDYAVIRGQKFRMRSGWAKLRRAFAVTCKVIEERRVELDEDWGYFFIVKATLPTGRSEDADGCCMSSELERSRITPTEHNVRAKALTRAKNRATSDVLGAGIVSAEEEDNEAKHWIDDPVTRKRFWAWARNQLALSDDDVHEALGVEHIRDFPGTKREAQEKIEFWVASQVAKRRSERQVEHAAQEADTQV